MLKKRFFNEERVANIFRWWSAAAVYFFIGWGTGLGNQTSSIDFVFILGLAIGIFEMLVVGPVIRNMFRTREAFKWREMSLNQRVWHRLSIFLRTFIILILVVQTYKVINVLAIVLFNLSSETVFLPGEPVLFGIFYIFYYIILTKLVQNVKTRISAEQ